MSKIKIVGLPEGYILLMDHDGKTFLLVLEIPDTNRLKKIKPFTHQPTLEECNDAITDWSAIQGWYNGSRRESI